MNSGLASADFSKGRPAAERSNKLRVPATIRNLITRIRLWLGKLFSLAFARVLLIFLLGFAAGIAWQSYGSGVRKAIAGWSPRLVWLAPAPAPSGGSAERFKAVSLALASARQSLDKLSTEINRLGCRFRSIADSHSDGSGPAICSAFCLRPPLQQPDCYDSWFSADQGGRGRWAE